MEQSKRTCPWRGKPMQAGYLAACLLLCLALCGCGSASEAASPAGSRTPPAESTEGPVQTSAPQPEQDETPARPDVTGEWHRTDCHSGLWATVTIDRQTEEDFRVTAGCFYFSHSGELEGTARFTGPDTALLEGYGVDGPYGYEVAPVGFRWEGEILTIESDTSGGDLGFGMNVTIDGTYTRDEPVYLNAGMLDRCLTAEQQAALRELLAENYGDYLVFPFQEGAVQGPSPCALPDGTAAEEYEVLFPTMGFYGLTLVAAEDGRIYYVNPDIGFYTNDSSADEMPALS